MTKLSIGRTTESIGLACVPLVLAQAALCHADDEFMVVASSGCDIFDREAGGAFRYGPSIIINPDDSIDVWTSSPGDGAVEQWDWIRHMRSTDGGYTWSEHTVVLQPTPGSVDHFSVCDPGVVVIGGYYHIGYTSTTDARGTDNNVFVARGTSPTGPFEKWNGSGWGGNPQPMIEFTGPTNQFGAGEPSFVVKDGTLYVYYSWLSSTAQTRVATASASDPNWPGNLTLQGVALSRGPGEDSTDVKYVDALGRFIGIGVRQRFSASSFLQVWDSTDGLTFTEAGEIRGSLHDWAHNAGISGTPEGHMDLAGDDNLVAYAYSPDDTVSWAYWSTHANPISIVPAVTATILHVDETAAGAGDGTSWTDACTTLLDALAIAKASGGRVEEVWVAEGTYTPIRGTVARSRSFELRSGLAVYGGFAGTEAVRSARDFAARVTVLSGEIGGAGDATDNSLHVVDGSGVDSTAVLDGFTITAGFANDFPSEHDAGGGMYNDGGSATVSNCTFAANSADAEGGGMYNDGGSTTVTNCTFIGNTAGADGGGMCNVDSSATVADCVFTENTARLGGGMGNRSANPVVTNCLFVGNTQFAGGMGAGLTGGAGMSNFEWSAPTVTNCTFTANAAQWKGGGIYNKEGAPTVTNCILWANTDEIGSVESSQISNRIGTAVVNYSCIQDADPDDAAIYAGTGNIDDDPLVLDASAGNLTLTDGSPAIDAGDNAAPNLPATDCDGNPRIANGTVDMGAYESRPSVLAPALSRWHVALLAGMTVLTGILLIDRRRRRSRTFGASEN